MQRLRRLLGRLAGRDKGREPPSRGDAHDSQETERLNAEYTGSFGRNPGQELGVLPPRYGRR